MLKLYLLKSLFSDLEESCSSFFKTQQAYEKV